MSLAHPTKKQKPARDYVAHHHTSILDNMRHMVAAGYSKHDAIEHIANAIDAALKLDAWIPGAVGVVAEALDGPFLRLVLNPLWDLAVGTATDAATDAA